MPRTRTRYQRQQEEEAQLAQAQAALQASAAHVQAQFEAAAAAAATAQQHLRSEADELQDQNLTGGGGMGGDGDTTGGMVEDEYMSEEAEEETRTEEDPDNIAEDESDTDVGLGELKEIGNLGAWTVSSYKPGCGVEALRDDDNNLYWQSDGPQPHHINIHFTRRVFIKRFRIFLDYDQDESYTPTKITLSSGFSEYDLMEVVTTQMEQPKGWIDVDLSNAHEDGILRTFLVQLTIHANHQNGKDTHVRGIKMYAPPKDEVPTYAKAFFGANNELDADVDDWMSFRPETTAGDSGIGGGGGGSVKGDVYADNDYDGDRDEEERYRNNADWKETQWTNSGMISEQEVR